MHQIIDVEFDECDAVKVIRISCPTSILKDFNTPYTIMCTLH